MSTRDLAAAAFAAALFCAPQAMARAYSVEDLLQTEGVGRVSFDPTGRWAVVEHRRPYASAARYDYNQQTGMLLTELLKIDLRRPGALAEPVFPQIEHGGVLAGPISPDGRRLLVYRLRDRTYELGVAELDRPAVRWLPLTPELANHGATAAWAGPHEVIAIVRAPGDLPRQMALGWEAQARLEGLWAQTREGRVPAATAVGSGRFLGVRPKETPARLVRIDVRSGKVTELASGEFQDLSLSPTGRWAAVIENGEDLQPATADKIYTAFPARRRHLRLVDLETGRVAQPCPDCDLAFGLLDWAARAPRLVVAARGPGPDGDGKALVVIDAASGAVTRPLPEGLTLDLQATQNEQAPRARALWMGDELLVFATSSSGRSDWYRLGGGRAINLTRPLIHAPRLLAAVSERSIKLAADGVLWEINWEGRARLLQRLDRAVVTPPPQEPHARAAANPRMPQRAVTLRAGQTVEQIEGGRSWRAVMPQGCAGPWVGKERIIALCPGPGGRRELRLAGGKSPWRAVLTINTGQADVEAAQVRRVRPLGARFDSWLYLPTTPPPEAGYPLVVIPYRGAVYPSPDARFAPGAFVAYLNPQILAAAGYAVLTPSLPYDEASGEPAAGLAADILEVVDAALADHPLDPERIGLWGHSFGAMNAVAAASQSQRFRSVIAVSGMHDITSRWGMIPVHRWVVPEDNASVGPSGTVEGAQARMGAPPWVDPQRYQRNSNIFMSPQITAPVLLIHGETDELRPEQSQELFTALYRQGKDAQFVTYWGEGHALASPANIRDYYARVLAWLADTLAPAAASAPRAAQIRADQ